MYYAQNILAGTMKTKQNNDGPRLTPTSIPARTPCQVGGRLTYLPRGRSLPARADDASGAKISKGENDE